VFSAKPGGGSGWPASSASVEGVDPENSFDVAQHLVAINIESGSDQRWLHEGAEWRAAGAQRATPAPRCFRPGTPPGDKALDRVRQYHDRSWAWFQPSQQTSLENFLWWSTPMFGFNSRGETAEPHITFCPQPPLTAYETIF